MGNSGGVPDIAVRLSAAGVQDVINAFARVRQEGKQLGTDVAAGGAVGAAGLDLMTKAAESLAELLPVITLAVAVDKLVGLGVGAEETAVAMGKLSEKTGAAVGTLSVLSLVAHDNEVDTDALAGGLVKLAKNQQDATEGSKKQLAAFTSLGISLNDLKTQDPAQLFVTLAQKLDTIPDGAQKAQIAITLFGKAGANLLPMLASLGTDGFEAALDKAKKLGIYLDSDMVDASRAAQEAIRELGDIANGLGTRFDAGFMPGFTQGVEVFAEAVEGDGVDSIRKFGEIAADVFKAIIGSIQLIGSTFAVIFKNGAEEFKYEFGQIGAGIQGASGGIAGIIAGVAGYNAQNSAAHNAVMQTNSDQYFQGLAKFQGQLTAPSTRKPSKRTAGGGGTGDGGAADDQTKLAQARAAYLQAQADNELAIQKTTNQLEEAEDKRHYDAGLLTVDEYYDKVEARVTANADAETAALQSKLDAAASLPATTDEQYYKRLEDINKIETQMSEVSLKQTGDLAAAEDQRSKANHDNALKELSDKEQLQKLDGDVYGAEQTQLAIELQQYDELLKKRSDLSAADRQALIDAANAKGQAKIGFGQTSQLANSGTQDMNQQIDGIQNQATAGLISQVDSQKQIRDLELQRLPVLQDLADEMEALALASGDITLKEQAAAFQANVQKMTTSLHTVTSASVELTNQLTGQGYTDLVDFFTAGIDGSKSFGDALTDLGNQFAQIVSKMVSQLLVYYALTELIGWVAPNSSFLTSMTAAGPFGKGFAGGGYTGDIPTNQIAGVVHGGEYVFDAATTSQNRALFDAISDGKTPTIKTLRSASVATTSNYGDELSSASSASSPPLVQVINTTGQQTSQKQTTGAGGQSITQIIIGTVTTDIANGGQVAKQLQTNYGLSRSGVKRA